VVVTEAIDELGRCILYVFQLGMALDFEDKLSIHKGMA
jgi:hypothetical protein